MRDETRETVWIVMWVAALALVALGAILMFVWLTLR